MTLRFRLITLLIPTFVGFLFLLSLFYIFNWHHDRVAYDQLRLKTIATLSSSFMELDTEATSSMLTSFKEELAIDDLYFVGVSSSQNENMKTIGTSYSLTTEEKKDLFLHKKPIATFFISHGGAKEKFILALAPVLKKEGQIAGFVVADKRAPSFHDTLEVGHIAFLAYLFLLLIATALFSIYLIANRITKPIEKLKDSALAIAAGEYGKTVQVQGPSEIVDLANILNTLSECLQEQVTRVVESGGWLDKQRHDEYESSIILQQQMWQKVVERARNLPLLVRTVDIFCHPIHGLYLDISYETDDVLTLTLVETKKTGFQGIYDLLVHTPIHRKLSEEEIPFPFLQMTLSLADYSLEAHLHEFFPPIIWSSRQNKPYTFEKGKTVLEPGDYLFIYNLGLLQLLHTQEAIEAWFHRTLRHFAPEGLESCVGILDRELLFLSRKTPVEWDVHILCLQLLK